MRTPNVIAVHTAAASSTGTPSPTRMTSVVQPRIAATA
jgi:hypothetical protein